MTHVVAIIGLGLIGGSLARDLSARGIRVLARDADRKSERAALDEGVISATIDDEYTMVAQARWLVIATPVGQSAAILERVQPHAARLELITDTGSTKRSIEHAASQLGLDDRFVGSHPLTGDHRTGWSASRAGLFHDARVYVCPSARSSASATAAAHALWEMCDAGVESIEAQAHDQLLAHTSHLPQLTSTALALALRDAGIAPDQLGPGGRDMLRLAASSPEMWRDIMQQNGDNVRAAVHGLQRWLDEALRALAQEDPAVMKHMFAEGRAWREGEE